MIRLLRTMVRTLLGLAASLMRADLTVFIDQNRRRWLAESIDAD